MEDNFKKIMCPNIIKTICLGLLINFISCAKNPSSTLLYIEKDLIPEGIAIDPVSEKVFLNSLYKNKIVRFDLDGRHPQDFIQKNQFGYLPGFGMTVKRDTLYALGNSHTTPSNQSILLLLKVSTGELIKKYTLKSLGKTYLNDIAVDTNGKFFITDSESSDIYSQNRETGHLETFFSDENIAHSNGIAISPNGKFLYIASMESGLRVLDIASKKLINRPNKFKGIDGLKFYKKNLIAIVNARKEPEKNGVFQYKLNPKGSEIIGPSKLMAFESPTDIPTTFAIFDDHMYFVSDSQMDLLNDSANKIIDSTKLEAYRLIKRSLLKQTFISKTPNKPDWGVRSHSKK
ncbi:SMP-30/gluconolactonase/LRE family protein [Flagellimonas lutimaris]|uniref:SMP-30/gluconolactonase/LRE family protein n=1 Tax=Flagellimonas lutimaris TaxID=475082 RepID=UPI003F5CDBAD